MWFYWLVNTQISTGDLESQFAPANDDQKYFLKYVFASSQVQGMWKERLEFLLKNFLHTFLKCYPFVKDRQSGAF
jgi:hypothetical protein